MVTSPTPNTTLHVTGITWKNATNSAGSIDANGVLRFIGNNLNGWRLFDFDYCEFHWIKKFPIFTQQTFGCVRHCLFSNTEGVAYTYATRWWPDGDPDQNPDNATYGTKYDNGDGSWCSPTRYGTHRMMYYEDNIINGSSTDVMFDGTEGGRICIRHNTINLIAGNKSPISHHGSEGRRRSFRHLEFYNNRFVSLGTERLLYQRGGTIVAFNNRCVANRQSNNTGQSKVVVTSDRGGDPTYWGRASGYSDVDVNVDVAHGFPGGTLGPAGTEPGRAKHFYQGTGLTGTGHVAGSTNPTKSIVVFSTTDISGWTDNMWVGFSVSDCGTTALPGNSRDLSGGANTQNPVPEWMGAVIISNDKRSVTTTQVGTYKTDHDFASGEIYKIYRVVHSHDGCGRAGVNFESRFIGGATDSNPTTLPAGYNTAGSPACLVTETCYEWNNYQTPAGSWDGNIDWDHGDDFYVRQDIHYQSDSRKLDYPNFVANATSTCGSVHDTSAISLPDTGTYPIRSVNQGTAGYQYPWQPNPSGVSGPQISVPAGPLAWGHQVVNTSVTKDIGVTNSGDSVLTVSAVSYPLSGYWVAGSAAPGLPFTVNPGATKNFPVTFTPTATGGVSGNITFTSDSGGGGNNVTNVTGIGDPVPVIPIMELPASPFAYGNVAVNTGSTKNIAV